MVNVILSLVFGAGLDSLYYFLYISKIKDINNKKLILYLGIFVGYVLFNMLLRYNFYLYLLFDVFIFTLLKILYKSQICDSFIILIVDIYSMLISLIVYFTVPFPILALVLDKTLLFLPLLFKNKLNIVYKKYLGLWNRSKEIKIIKSLTLRNINLLVLNIFITIAYFVLLYLTSLNS